MPAGIFSACANTNLVAGPAVCEGMSPLTDLANVIDDAEAAAGDAAGGAAVDTTTDGLFREMRVMRVDGRRATCVWCTGGRTAVVVGDLQCVAVRPPSWELGKARHGAATALGGNCCMQDDATWKSSFGEKA